MPTICSTCGLTIPKSGCANSALAPVKCPNSKPSKQQALEALEWLDAAAHTSASDHHFKAYYELRQFIESAGAGQARYQYLRGGRARKPENVSGGYIQTYRWLDRSEGEALKGDALDAAIDAAIAARSPQPGDRA